MQHVVRVERLVSVIPTAVVRRRANQRDLAKVVPEACGIVWRALRAGQVQGAGRHVAFYLDGQINLEVGVELAAPLPGDANLSDAVVASALPVGTVAATTHLGPYPQLHHAHVAILRVVHRARLHPRRAELGDLRPLGRRLERGPQPDPHRRLLPAENSRHAG